MTLEQALELGGTGRAPEELLVLETEEGMDVALYLAPQLLEQLEAFAARPAEALQGASLGSFCTLIEGVSHFIYLSRSLELERKVSLLELEAQAEVDKFATCVALSWPAWDSSSATTTAAPAPRGREWEQWTSTFFRRLFDDASYRADLQPHERWRYEEANRLSRNYCEGLMQHVRNLRRDRFLAELRYSYRLGADAKLRHMSHRLRAH